MKQKLFILTSVLGLALQVGCGLEVTGEKKEEQKPAPVNPFTDSRPSIQGVHLEGRWLSRCHPKPAAIGENRILEMSFKGDEIQRKETIFNNSSCVGQPTRQVSWAGPYRFVEVYPDGSYELEYAFRIEGGFQTTMEKIMKMESQLYVSDFVVGPLGLVNKQNPLMRVEGSEPQTSQACQSYAGKWNMNSQYIRIQQEGCQLIRWSNLPVFPTDVEKEAVYVLDDKERTVEGVTRRSLIENRLWVNYIRTATGIRKQVFSMEKKPCSLMNPSGETYLTLRTFEGNQEINCTFFARSN